MGYNKLVFFVLVSIVFFASFVIAGHVITTSAGGSSYSVDEDVGSVYNITVNNTDTTAAANISQVNITIPGTFSFSLDSNGTNAGTHTFTNTSTVLTWDNDGLVMNLTWNHFWFTATASTPGTYNLTVTTLNATSSYETNISVTVNDTTDPSSIDFVSPSETDNTNLSRSNIAVNVTGTDNGVIDTIIIRLFNSTRDQINSSSSSTSPVFINFTGLSDGVYYFNATINDTYGNENFTATRTVTLDSSAPAITLIYPDDLASATTNEYNFTFNVTDDQDVSNCSLILDGSVAHMITNINNSGGTMGMYNSSLGTGSHTWSVNCTDVAGNVDNSSTRTFTVTTASSSSSSSSPDGGYAILRPKESELNSGYRKAMQEEWEISFKVGDRSHTLKINEIMDSSLKFSISSETQEATLSVGEEKKFELTGDNYYDLSVTLNSIDIAWKNKADITVNTIQEEILEPKSEKVQEEEKSETVPQPAATREDLGDEKGISWLWIIAIIVIIVGIFYGAQKYKMSRA